MIVYICHPYSNDPLSNQRKAAAIARHVASLGHTPMCVHTMFPPIFDEDTQRKRIMRCCLELVKASDQVWIYGNPTEGMQQEIEMGARHGKPLRFARVNAPAHHGPKMLIPEEEEDTQEASESDDSEPEDDTPVWTLAEPWRVSGGVASAVVESSRGWRFCVNISQMTLRPFLYGYRATFTSDGDDLGSVMAERPSVRDTLVCGSILYCARQAPSVNGSRNLASLERWARAVDLPRVDPKTGRLSRTD